jgi:hypothetical protein
MVINITITILDIIQKTETESNVRDVVSQTKDNVQNCDKQTNKLHGLSPRANYTDRATPLVGEMIANFCG